MSPRVLLGVSLRKGDERGGAACGLTHFPDPLMERVSEWEILRHLWAAVLSILDARYDLEV